MSDGSTDNTRGRSSAYQNAPVTQNFSYPAVPDFSQRSFNPFSVPYDPSAFYPNNISQNAVSTNINNYLIIFISSAFLAYLVKK